MIASLYQHSTLIVVSPAYLGATSEISITSFIDVFYKSAWFTLMGMVSVVGLTYFLSFVVYNNSVVDGIPASMDYAYRQEYPN